MRWDSRSQERMLPLNSKIFLFIKWIITVDGTSVSNSFESCPMMSYNSVVFYICSKNAWKAVITKIQQLNSSVHCDAVRGEGAITPVRHLQRHPCSNAFFAFSSFSGSNQLAGCVPACGPQGPAGQVAISWTTNFVDIMACYHPRPSTSLGPARWSWVKSVPASPSTRVHSPARSTVEAELAAR